MFFGLQACLHELVSRATGDREKGGTLIHVAEVRLVAQFEFPGDLALLLAESFGQGIEHLFADAAVEIVDVNLLHTLAETLALDLEAPDRGIVIFAHRAEAFAQYVVQPLEHVLRDRQAIEHVAELLDECLLADIGLGAFPFRVAAAVVDVLLLLDVADQQAAAMSAVDHAGEEEVLLDSADASGVAAVQDGLNPLPQLHRDERRMRAAVALAEPLELAGVDARAKYLVHAAGADRPDAATKGHAFRPRHLRRLLQRVAPGRIPFEEPGHALGATRVRFDHPLAVRPHDVAVAGGRDRRPDALLGLFEHPLADFLRQIVDIVLGHQHLDAVEELLRRARVGGKDDILLGEVDLEVEFVDRHPVAQVAVEAVSLLHQDGVGCRVAAQIADHLVEVGPPGSLGGLDIDELAGDADAILLRIGAQKLELRIDREALALLLLGRDAGIEDGAPNLLSRLAAYGFRSSHWTSPR